MKNYRRLPTDDIIVQEGRQRVNVNSAELETLMTSIKEIGMLSPIVVRPGPNGKCILVAGERRLTAVKKLGWLQVPCNFLSELDEYSAKVAEFEENVRRVDLTWQEQMQAIVNYHELRTKSIDSWKVDDTAEALRMHKNHVHKALAIARSAEAEPELLKAETFTSAHNRIARKNQRAIATEMERMEDETSFDLTEDASENLLEGEPSDGLRTVHKAAPGVTVSSKVSQTAPAKSARLPVHNIDFLSWAPEYDGPKFNFIHCDFPYGVGMDKSDQRQTKKGGAKAYQDSPDIYFALLDCLCNNHERLLMHSAHMVFWFSMKFYQPTVEQLTKAGFDVNPFPLVWHKTDSKGLLPDAKRGPRRTYETALLCTLGDRFIVQAVNNSYACPTGSDHFSEKPEPMLKNFFRMLVDSNTEMLDPTCGSGTSLRAAEANKACRVMGLDIDPEHVELANREIARTRRLAKLGEAI